LEQAFGLQVVGAAISGLYRMRAVQKIGEGHDFEDICYCVARNLDDGLRRLPIAWVVVVAAGAMCRNQGPGTGRPMLMAGICLCITIIVIITAGGATAIDTAGKLRPKASISSASQPWRKAAFD
jgi:hypothetical protein